MARQRWPIQSKAAPRIRVIARMYSAGTFLILCGLAGTLGLLPLHLSSFFYLIMGAGGGLWLIGLVLEAKASGRKELAATPSHNHSQNVTPVAPIDQQLAAALEFQDRAQKELAEEAEDFAAMLPREEFFIAGRPIEITFDDLRHLPSLVAQAVEDYLDLTPALDPSTVRARGDRYHVRTNGPRFDIRTLRSLN